MGYEFVACDAGDTQLSEDRVFYLNCSAMGILEAVLDTLGVLDRQMQRPEMTPLVYIDDAAPDCEELKEQFYLARSVRSKNPGQVPAFKLESDDGWHVTADECAVIAEALPRCNFIRGFGPVRDSSGALMGEEDAVMEMLQDVADYCARCAARQGFVVY